MSNEKKGEKEKKDNAMTIAIIGLVGTLVAAALSSPVLIELIKSNQATETPAGSVDTPVGNTETPSGSIETPTGSVETPVASSLTPAYSETNLIFSEDFENDKASGFSFDGGEWSIGKEKSNKVLQVDTTSLAQGTVARAIFGPSDFDNGIIEFQIRIDQFVGNDATANLYFRSSNQSAYSLALMQDYTILGYRDSQNDWELEPFGAETSRPFTFETGTWYSIRLEARGTQFTVSIDNNRIFNAEDSRLQKGGLEFILNPGLQAMFDNVNVMEFK